MTTWAEVKTFVGKSFKYEEVNEHLLKFLFDTEGGRSQLIFIEHAFNDSADWIKFNSPIGKVENVNIATAARMLAGRIVGGITIEGDVVVVTNSMPLENLDANEIEEPLVRIALIADELESLLTGGDTW